jgi:hypothetical protein
VHIHRVHREEHKLAKVFGGPPELNWTVIPMKLREEKMLTHFNSFSLPQNVVIYFEWRSETSKNMLERPLLTTLWL